MHHLLHLIMYDRHFWQRISLSELSELYISMMIKSLALSLIAVFIPVYLYQSGFSITEIGIFYAYFFIFRIPLNYGAGFMTARFGPQRIIALSYLLLAMSLAQFISLSYVDWPLIVLAFFYAVYDSMFFIPYNVEFARICDYKKAGHELSTMQIIVRVAAALGPFIGGIIATLFSINLTLILALILVVVAAWPMMMNNSPGLKKQKVDFASFDIRKNFRDIVAYAAIAIERQVLLVIWPLYISVFIFVDDVYAKVGLVTSLSVGCAILFSRFFGKIVDNKKGRTLLNAAALLSAVVHGFRAFVQSMGGVVSTNLSAEIASSGVVLPFLKGFYGEAEKAKDPVAYITVMEVSISIIRAVFWIILINVMIYSNEKLALTLSFYVASIAALLIMLNKFRISDE